MMATPAMRVKNFFIEDFQNHTTVLRLFKPSQRLVEAILLTITDTDIPLHSTWGMILCREM